MPTSSAVIPGNWPPLEDVQHGAERGGGVDRHRRRLVVVGQLQQVVEAAGRVGADVDGQAVGDHLLQEGQELDAGRARSNSTSVARRGAAVLVVGVELVRLGEPLLDVPAAAAVDAGVEGEAVGGGAATTTICSLAARSSSSVAGRIVGVEPGRGEHLPVVVEDRVRDVERHRPAARPRACSTSSARGRSRTGRSRRRRRRSATGTIVPESAMRLECCTRACCTTSGRSSGSTAAYLSKSRCSRPG